MVLDRIIWSDEASFNLSGTVNRYNQVWWSKENPHEMLVKRLKSDSLSVLGAVSSKGILGPFFFPKTVTGASFLKIMEEEMIPAISSMFDLNEIIFQLDGAPGHWSRFVREFLDEKFPSRWIGRGGPISWPPRSPDLTPPDFFLWGFIKDKTYAQDPKTTEDLRVAIKHAFDAVTITMCQNVVKSVQTRMQRCLEADGQQIQ